MDEEIIHRIQSLEFYSSKLTDYLISKTSENKSDYLIENYLINGRRKQLVELNEALKNGLIDRIGYEFMCHKLSRNFTKRLQECKSTSISFGLKNIQNVDSAGFWNKKLEGKNSKFKEINLKKFLEFRKENLPECQNLMEYFNRRTANKLDLKFFSEKKPLTHSQGDVSKNQNVFVKPTIPNPSLSVNADYNLNALNDSKPISKVAENSQLQRFSFKSNSIQATNNSGMMGSNGQSTYHPAASIMNSLNKNNNTNNAYSGVTSNSMNGMNNANSSAMNGINSNQQYFAKLNAMKYEPQASRCYKRRKDDESEKEEEDLMREYDHGSQNNPFKSARDQMILDNAKKNNQNTQQQNMGSQAKRPMTNLPSRGAGNGNGNNGGSGIHKKFNCPFRPADDNGNSAANNNMNSNQNNDARNNQAQELANVKNIDQKLIDTIMNEVMDKTPAITWEDIAGLEFVKKTIKEIVIWPMMRPDIFKGLRGPPKGLLLFGPPGTGKTLIAKTIANESKSTFFNISSSVLTSKWQGESEKLVKVLFEVARSFQPSVIFIDEIDSLLSQRSDEDRESSRRLKTEFFIQMDGCGTASEERILLIGATNRPQELDDAARRRFVKKLYIPLPESLGRRQIVSNLMRKQGDVLTEEEIEKIAEITDGYSGADMTNLCREAAIGPIRAIESSSIINISVSQVRSINFQDFIDAMQQVRASVSQEDLEAYFKWNSQFGTMAIPK